MPHMAHVFTVRFHQKPAPGADFKWPMTEPIEVEAMDEATALRLARRSLELDDSWLVRECRDLGAWNKQPGV